jgi:hypothetical protein
MKKPYGLGPGGTTSCGEAADCPARAAVAGRKFAGRAAPGFVRRIDNEPGKCNGAPASAYWSNWHAKPHGKWIYSTLGAGSYRPK